MKKTLTILFLLLTFNLFSQKKQVHNFESNGVTFVGETYRILSDSIVIPDTQYIVIARLIEKEEILTIGGKQRKVYSIDIGAEYGYYVNGIFYDFQWKEIDWTDIIHVRPRKLKTKD